MGQTNLSNTTDKIKVPDIESQSTQQEMSAIKNMTNSTDATQQANVSNITNQSLRELTNGAMNGSAILTNRSANF